jgi:phage terminase large subunit-like protein
MVSIVQCLMAGGKDGILNPLVHNMAPAYEAARYDLIWVSTSRIAGETTEDRHALRCLSVAELIN